MLIYEIFSHADRFYHRAHLISGASCAIFVCTILTYLSPFLLTYYTGDLWKRESIYSEQPRLNNTVKYLFILNNDGTSSNRFLISSFSNLNNINRDAFIPGVISEGSADTDGDGLIDQYRISLDITGASTLQINAINVWLFFPFELRGRQRITMEALGLVTYVPSAPLPMSANREINIYGQLKFQQRQTIGSAGLSAEYSRPKLDLEIATSSTDFDAILRDYFQQKYFTTFENQYVYEEFRDSSQPDGLTLTIVVNIGRQAIRFAPGFWEEFKWGWIQYVCTLIPFVALFNRLKLFVFSNQLVRTLTPIAVHRHQA